MAEDIIPKLPNKTPRETAKQLERKLSDAEDELEERYKHSADLQARLEQTRESLNVERDDGTDAPLSAGETDDE